MSYDLYGDARRAAERKRARDQKTGMALLGCVGAIAALFTGPWIIMLALGALHHDLDAAVPALGYWTVFVVYFGLSTGLALFKGVFRGK